MASCARALADRIHGAAVKTIVAFLMMLASAAAYGQLFKCIGKDGRVEYAGQCPPGTTAQQTGIKSTGGGPAPSAAPQQKSLAERDAEFKKRLVEQQEAQQKAQKQAAEAEQKRRGCENARAYLQSLQAGMRITRFDPKTGERVYLEDAEYAAETAKAQRAVEQNCR